MVHRTVEQRGWRKAFGDRGEAQAAAYLERLGYQILERNCRIGHREIDLIAEDGETLVFVEVKARRDARFGPPEMAVDSRKQKQLSLAAVAYLQSHECLDRPCRFDVIGITYQNARAEISHTRNAFELVGEYRY